MKKALFILLFVLIAAILSGCGGVKSKVYTSASKDSILKEIGESGLTDDEKNLFAQAIIKEALSGEKIDGKKVGEIIDNQRAFIKEQERLEAERKVKLAALEKQLQGHLVLGIKSKRNLPENIYAGRYSNSIVWELEMANVGTKDIKAFKGYFQIKDLVGQPVTTLTYYSDDLLSAGKAETIKIRSDINEFIDTQMKLYNADLSKLKYTWKTTALVFTDGTEIIGSHSPNP